MDKHGVMHLILSDTADTPGVLTSTCQPLKGGWPGAGAWRPQGQSSGMETTRRGQQLH